MEIEEIWCDDYSDGKTSLMYYIRFGQKEGEHHIPYSSIKEWSVHSISMSILRKGSIRMTRQEENRKVIKEMSKRTECKPARTYEEMVTFQLGVIATMLADISQSLAICADKAESEVEE